jgi:vesicle coat complex subunit
MNFTPQNPGDAEIIAERIAPRLQHANSSVVLTTIKVILYLTNYMSKDDDIATLCKKLSPPLGIQCVAVHSADWLSDVTVKATRITIRGAAERAIDLGETSGNPEE